jgi:hypothetical protein
MYTKLFVKRLNNIRTNGVVAVVCLKMMIKDDDRSSSLV